VIPTALFDNRFVPIQAVPAFRPMSGQGERPSDSARALQEPVAVGTHYTRGSDSHLTSVS